jgi:hypothetical protein
MVSAVKTPIHCDLLTFISFNRAMATIVVLLVYLYQGQPDNGQENISHNHS